VTAAYVTAGLDQGWADLYHDIATRPAYDEPKGDKQLGILGPVVAASARTLMTKKLGTVPRGSSGIYSDQERRFDPFRSGIPDRGLRPDLGTRLVPKGMPKNFRVAEAKKSPGVYYYDPKNRGNAVRVMQAKPGSRFESCRKAYVRWQKDGHALDVNGRRLESAMCPEAHIPVADFKLMPEVFNE
jgi:hypothetical protein